MKVQCVDNVVKKGGKVILLALIVGKAYEAQSVASFFSNKFLVFNDALVWKRYDANRFVPVYDNPMQNVGLSPAGKI